MSVTLSGKGVARALMGVTLAVLLGASLLSHSPADWFNAATAWSQEGWRGLFGFAVRNACGLMGMLVSHVLLRVLGELASWAVVVMVLTWAVAPLWEGLERRLRYWMLVVAGMGLVSSAASGLWAPELFRGPGILGEALARGGVRVLGKWGMGLVVGVTGIVLAFHAVGGFSWRLSLRARAGPRRVSERPEPSSSRELPQDGPPPEVAFPPAEEVPPPAVTTASVLPPLSCLLCEGPIQPFVDSKEIERRRAKLEEALASFGVTARVVRVVPGPVITRFEVEPAPGIKVSRIESLANDLSLALKALQTRVVAPIPGTGVVGIEVPNRKPAIVRLGDLMQSALFQTSRAPLLLPVGRDTVGEPVACDLATIPHLLIGGTTGSGKSSCINSFLCGMLLRTTPQMVRFLLIDPKRVELCVYEGIPHLMYPVVVDPKVALKALTWTAQEMERRYQVLSRTGLRDIAEFQSRFPDQASSMPYVVVVIDELADLMMSAPAEMEAVIIRLAQKARAVGIHLIVATQRPSKEIVTGVLKSNFPGRIAFKVMQRVNSHIILDTGGAEQLLGRGDMLFLPPGAPAPQRVHGAFVTAEEIRRVVEHWRSQVGPGHPSVDVPVPAPSAEDGVEEDPLWEDAARLVILNKLGSTSLLQRRLKVGYARAGRLMDILERKGVVGPAQGSKPREVLVDASWLEQGVRGSQDS